MAQCYDWNSDTQQVEQLPTNIWFQCPSGNTCCVGGSICLDYNLCHTPGSSTSDVGSYSSYYVARCSDPTYTSPDCQKVCGKYKLVAEKYTITRRLIRASAVNRCSRSSRCSLQLHISTVELLWEGCVRKCQRKSSGDSVNNAQFLLYQLGRF